MARCYPFDISAVYVNFNQKLSLFEDESMRNMQNFFGVSQCKLVSNLYLI
jgi:hypothetical protein